MVRGRSGQWCTALLAASVTIGCGAPRPRDPTSGAGAPSEHEEAPPPTTALSVADVLELCKQALDPMAHMALTYACTAFACSHGRGEQAEEFASVLTKPDLAERANQHCKGHGILLPIGQARSGVISTLGSGESVESGFRADEHYADVGGFCDQVTSDLQTIDPVMLFACTDWSCRQVETAKAQHRGRALRDRDPEHFAIAMEACDVYNISIPASD